MTLVEFDARLRSDRLIGFYVPTSLLPGQTCSFQTTISQPAPPTGGPSTIFKIMTFTQVVASDRHVVFSVPTDVPLGTFHFTVIISVMSTLAAATPTAAPTETVTADETVA